MKDEYTIYKKLNLTEVSEKILKKWSDEDTFNKSINSRKEENNFVFYEGPPSANGLPGIHHVMARAIKDVFCRYKSLKGYRVNRKAGWDTHGLPVELGVEKQLGITKEDIGKSVSIQEYNEACKKAVMKYTDIWNDLTEKMGYWVDMSDPYITYENKYIESVWWLLNNIYKKNLLYKGYTIQPYSPMAGTGLSTHELNQPGCYKIVKDTSVTAQFKLLESGSKQKTFGDDPCYLMAWTTTPWTLPSNTALAINKKINYVVVQTFNQYTFKAIKVVLAESLLSKYFSGNYYNEENELSYNGEKKIPFKIIKTITGEQLLGLKYEQLLPFALPYENPENAFVVIQGDFVTTEDGTGIVHVAPTFGADDARVASENNVPGLLVKDENDKLVPLVNLQGAFRKEMEQFAGKYVKNEYYPKDSIPEKSVDVEIAILLKEKNRAFKVEKYEHSYPHCWRTDFPILYYPLDSWFVKVTDFKDKLVNNNKTINWKPSSTGTGRFGNWLENANDWNLSRSRYWGIPIPIWRTEDGKQEICIDSINSLKEEINKSVAAGLMKENPLEDFLPGDMSEENYNILDLHKNFVDNITLISDSGEPMKREADLIDVWFDSGAMPYASLHYPFENKTLIDNNKSFPADFIAEGVDQTRGWFYTLHTIATMCFDSVAYKNVVSNGLVLDKNGHKMSKRLGNALDPFKVLNEYSADATRWYMMTNAQAWDNLKFNTDGIVEVQRKFFGTLYNTYGFFALYANLDKFSYSEKEIPYNERCEIDRWILSKLNSLIKNVNSSYSNYEATKAGRLIQSFVIDQLSNWYVRLCRRRFWKGDYSKDKISAYQTLYTCLETVAILASPIAPFYCDQLFCDLTKVSKKLKAESVHLANFPDSNETSIDLDLERKMEIAQQITSLVLGLRKKEKIKVRQPLNKILIPAINNNFEKQLMSVKDLILSEVNIKNIEVLKDENSILKKKAKPNFSSIGPKYGKHMKAISTMINSWKDKEIKDFEINKSWNGEINSELITLGQEDIELITEDIPGYTVASDNEITVALDISITDELRNEGIAREFVNRIQNLRKDSGFDVSDKIEIHIKSNLKINNAINNNLSYICSETLAKSLIITEEPLINHIDIEIDKNTNAHLSILKAK